MLKTGLFRCCHVTRNIQLMTVGFSTSQQHFSKNINNRRRWASPEKWKELKTSTGKIPWQPNIPYTKETDHFSEEEAYKGMYDYLAILGDDVTLQPKLFCKGPAHIRGHNESELKRLLQKRRMLGYRMHIEDLDACNKRIRYLVREKQKKEGF